VTQQVLSILLADARRAQPTSERVPQIVCAQIAKSGL
jgi:hypothetical protein